MSRSDWGFVAALIGCLILSAAAVYDSNRRHHSDEQSSYQQGITAASIIKPADSANNPDPAHPKCPDEHGSKTDCTVVATKAAVDQAKYSREQAGAAIIGVAIGAFTLIAAAIAAYYASRAASETQRGADAAESAVTETRRIGEAQVRAYVDIKEACFSFDPKNFGVKITAANTGQSPALDFKWAAWISVHTIMSIGPQFADKLRRNQIPKLDIYIGVPIGSSSSVATQYTRFDQIENFRYLQDEEREMILLHNCRLRVSVSVIWSWNDVFGTREKVNLARFSAVEFTGLQPKEAVLTRLM